MAVPDMARVAGPYYGNGLTTLFPFAFKALRPEDVVLLVTDPTGVLVPSPVYSVELEAEPTFGGVVRLADPLPFERVAYVVGEAERAQFVTLANQGAFHAEDVMRALDRNTILVQELSGQVDRSLRFTSYLDNLDTALPMPPVPETYLRVRSDGVGFEWSNAIGPRGPRGEKGERGPTGAEIALNLIGSTPPDEFPETANDGEAWLIAEGPLAGIWLWWDGQWSRVIEFNDLSDRPITNSIFVDPQGSPTATGRTLRNAVPTIEHALDIMWALPDPSCIFVYPGTYATEGLLDVRDGCGVVAPGGQYTTTLSVTAPENNAFRVGSGSYVQGFAFTGQRVNDFDNPLGGFAVAFRPGAVVRRSPYIRDISQISNYNPGTTPPLLDPDNANPAVGRGGGTLLADRAVLDPASTFPYMLAFGATPRSPNGIGYCARNGAGLNGIGAITIFQRIAFLAIDGGHITLNNSGTQFGDISMAAIGSFSFGGSEYPSLVESLGHQFNLAGSGVNERALPPSFGFYGVPRPAAQSVLQRDGGRVVWSGSDEQNNSYFAGGLRVNGQTGRLEGRPFTSAVRRMARRAANMRSY